MHGGTGATVGSLRSRLVKIGAIASGSTLARRQRQSFSSLEGFDAVRVGTPLDELLVNLARHASTYSSSGLGRCAEAPLIRASPRCAFADAG
jgi:hypothetical protein